MSSDAAYPGRLRVVGASGSNRAMEAELKRLAPRALGERLPKPERLDPQTLVFDFQPALAWLAVRYARTPSRVLWDLFDVDPTRLEPLYEAVVEQLLEMRPPWMREGARISVEVRRSDLFPAGPLQIRGAVKNAIMDAGRQLGVRLELSPESPDLLFRVEADDIGATLSLDLGGRSLHRRGYRKQTSEASLKETLAAQMLLLARWDARSEALIDPMTGAGTLLLEGWGAALGSTTWPSGPPPIGDFAPFDTLPKEAPDLFPGTPPPMAGIEVHTPTFRALTQNLDSATDAITAIHGDFRDFPGDMIAKEMGHAHLPDKGLVIVNPPYGERLEKGRGHDPELDALYEDLRQWWLSLGPGWRIAILGPGRPLKAIFGGHPKLDKPMRNGPLSVSLLVYDGASS